MDRRPHDEKLGVAVSVIALGVLFVFALNLFYSDKNGLIKKTPLEETLPTVAVAHAYASGMHTVRGSLSLPTPCHRLFSQPVFDDAGRASVTLAFNIHTVSMDCPAEPREETFMFSFSGPPDTTFHAILNGDPAMLEVRDEMQPE